MEYNFEKRIKILKYLDNDELTNLIIHYGVLYFMPLDFIEGFDSISKLVFENLEKISLKKLFHHLAVLLILWKYSMFRGIKTGTKIIGHNRRCIMN